MSIGFYNYLEIFQYNFIKPFEIVYRGFLFCRVGMPFDIVTRHDPGTLPGGAVRAGRTPSGDMGRAIGGGVSAVSGFYKKKTLFKIPQN